MQLQQLRRCQCLYNVLVRQVNSVRREYGSSDCRYWISWASSLQLLSCQHLYFSPYRGCSYCLWSSWAAISGEAGLRGRYLYFCTSKASKLRSYCLWISWAAFSEEAESPSAGISVCNGLLVKQVNWGRLECECSDCRSISWAACSGAAGDSVCTLVLVKQVTKQVLLYY